MHSVRACLCTCESTITEVRTYLIVNTSILGEQEDVFGWRADLCVCVQITIYITSAITGGCGSFHKHGGGGYSPPAPLLLTPVHSSMFIHCMFIGGPPQGPKQCMCTYI